MPTTVSFSAGEGRLHLNLSLCILANQCYDYDLDCLQAVGRDFGLGGGGGYPGAGFPVGGYPGGGGYPPAGKLAVRFNSPS
jgi:hypothetical protein